VLNIARSLLAKFMLALKYHRLPRNGPWVGSLTELLLQSTFFTAH